MTRYKIVFSDIDGTALDSSHKISNGLKESVERLKNINVPFVLASARMPKAMKNIRDGLKASEYMVCYSGSMVLKGEQIIFEEKIPPDILKEIIAAGKKTGLSLNIYIDDEWYVEKIDRAIQEEADITGVTPKIITAEGLLEKNTGANKVLIIESEEKINRFCNITAHLSESISITHSKSEYVEIMPKNVTKSYGIITVCKDLKINPEEAIAAGDSEMDIDMFRAVKGSIAMGNAPEYVKKEALYTADNCNKGGLAKALNKIFEI